MTEKSNPVNELLSASLSGRISRRDVLKRATQLGLSAPLVGLLVSAHSRGTLAQDATPGATPAAQPAGWSLTKPTNLPTGLSGKITVIMGQDGSGVPWEVAASKMFTEITGVEVNRISGPASTTDRNTQYLQVFNAGGSDIDACMIDVVFPATFAPYAVDLSAELKANNVDYLQAIVDNNTVDGVLTSIPWYTDAGVLYYRKDLLAKYNIANPPTTWAELETAAQTIQDGERAAGNANFWGFVFQGAAYEGLTCDALEWQVSNGGGSIVEPDKTVSVNNPQVVAAMQRAAAWVGKIAPPGVTGYQEEDARAVWQGGNAAFMRNWPYAYANGQAADSVIKDKFDVEPLPKGDGDGARNADTLGGWQMMASKFSKNLDAAKAYCQFMCTTEVQKSHAIELSTLPTIGALYDDADILAANPFFGSLKGIFTGGAVVRPSTAAAEYYPDVSQAYFTAINQILTGSDAAKTISDLEGKIKDIMAGN
jgi:trehalose/maltose transport system substrate-binding protein